MSKLDLKIIQDLYEFGCLIAYEVRRFDVISFSVQVDMRTFNKEVAEKRCEKLLAEGIKADIFSYFVNFNGAYAQK